MFFRLALIVSLCALGNSQVVNNNPSFGRGPDVTVDQNSGTYQAAWVASGPDDGDAGTQSLSFTVTALTPQLFSRQPTLTPTGELDFRPANGQIGSSLVEVILRDDGITSCATCTCSPTDCSRSIRQTFRITVRFVNQRPSFENAGDVSVTMNSGSTTISNWGFNLLRGPNNNDENTQTLSWVVSAPTVGSLFRQAPSITAQGHLKFEPAPDQFGFDTFTVTLVDSGGTANGGQDTSVAYTVRIDVTYVNSPPFFTPGPDTIQVDEDSGAGSQMWATGIDPGNPGETSQSVRFVLEWTNPSCQDIFTRQPTMAPNGEISWELAPDMDTIQFSCKMRVQAQDDDPSDPKNSCPMTSCDTIEFIVQPINDPPFFIPGPNLTVWEDLKNEVTPPGVPAAAALVDWVRDLTPGNQHEEDAHGQTVRFVVEPDNPTLFHELPTIDATGTLRYTLAAHTNGRTTMRVTIFDSEDMQGNTEILTLEVLSSNNQPEFDYAVTTPISVPQDCGDQTINVFLRNVNQGPGQALDEFNVQDMTIVAGTPSAPELFTNIPHVQFSGSNTASLRFTCKPGESGASNQTITLADDGGTFRRGEDRLVRTFEIIIVPNIVPPTFSFENEVVQVVQGQCDAGCNFANFAMNVNSGNPDATSQVTFAVVSADPSLFAEPPAIASSGALSFRTTANTNGRSVSTVVATSVESGQSSITGKTFTVVVIPVNTAPFFTPGSSFTGTAAIPECVDLTAGCVHSFGGWATNIRKGAAGSTQEDAQQIVFRAVVAAEQRAFFSDAGIRIDATTGTLSFTLRQGAGATSGTFTVPITLVDDGGTSYGGVDTFSTSIEFSIEAFKSPPSAAIANSVSVYQGSGSTLSQDFLTGVSAGYIPTGSSALAVLSVSVAASDTTIFTTPPIAQFTSATTASLSFTLAPFVSGQFSITVTLRNSESGKDFVGSSTLLVVTYNHAPTFSLISPTIAVDKNSGASTTQVAQDVSAGPGTENTVQVVSFVLACGSLGLFVAPPSVSRSGILSFTPVTDAVGTASCTLQAKDSGGTSTRPIAGIVAPVSHDTSEEVALTIKIRAVLSAPSFRVLPTAAAVQAQGLVGLANFATDINTGNPQVPTVNQTNAADFVFDLACSTATSPSDELFDVLPALSTVTGALAFSTKNTVTGTVSCTAVLRNLRASDSALASSATQRFAISIAHVNTMPSFRPSVATLVTGYDAANVLQRVPAWASDIVAGNADPSLSFTVTTPSVALFVGTPAVALPSGDLTFVLAENAVGEAALSVCLVARGGQWATNPGAPTQLSANVSVCHSLQLISRRSETPPTVITSRTSVVALQNGGVLGSSTESQRTVSVQRFASKMVPGSAAARGNDPSIVAASLECSVCTIQNASGTLSGLVSSSSLVTERDSSTSTSSYIPSYIAELRLVLRQDVTGTCRTCVLRATDNQGAVGVSANFELQVVAVNQPPSFSLAASSSTLPIAGGYRATVRALPGRRMTVPNWVAQRSPGPSAEAAQTVTIQLLGLTTAPLLFQEPPAVSPTGELSFTFASDAAANQSASFTVVARDNGGTDNGGQDTVTEVTLASGLSAPLELMLLVAPALNQPPSFTVQPRVEAVASTGVITVPSWIQGLSNGGRPVAEVTVSSITTNNSALFAAHPTVDVAAGTLRFEPIGAGAATISVMLRNQGGTEFGAFDAAERTGLIVTTARAPELTLELVSPLALSAVSTSAFSGVTIASRASPETASLSLSSCAPSNPFQSVVFGTAFVADLMLQPNASGTFECEWRFAAGGAQISRTSVLTVEGRPLPPTGRLQGSSTIVLQQALVDRVEQIPGFVVDVAPGRGGSYASTARVTTSVACNTTLAFTASPSVTALNASGALDLALPLSSGFAGNVGCEVRIVDASGELSVVFALRVLRTNRPPTLALTAPFVDVSFGQTTTATIGAVTDDSVAAVTVTTALVSSFPVGATLENYCTVQPTVSVSNGAVAVTVAAAYSPGRFNLSVTATDAEGGVSLPQFVTLSIDGGVPASSPVTAPSYLTAVLAGSVDTFSRAQFRQLAASVLSADGFTVTPEHVTILTVRAGSVVVTFTFTRSGSNATAEERALVTAFPSALQAGTPAAGAFVGTLGVQSVATSAPQSTTAAPAGTNGQQQPTPADDGSWWEDDWVAYVVIALLVVILLCVAIGICLCVRNRSRASTAEADEGSRSRSRRRQRTAKYQETDDFDDIDESPAAPPRHPTEDWYPVKSQGRRRPTTDDFWVEVDPEVPPQPTSYDWRDTTQISRHAHAGSPQYPQHHQSSFAQPAVYRSEARR